MDTTTHITPRGLTSVEARIFDRLRTRLTPAQLVDVALGGSDHGLTHREVLVVKLVGAGSGLVA